MCQHRAGEECPGEHHRRRAAHTLLPQDRPVHRYGAKQQGERDSRLPGTATVGVRLWQGGYAESHHHSRQCRQRLCPCEGDVGVAKQRHLRQGGATEEGCDDRPR